MDDDFGFVKRQPGAAATALVSPPPPPATKNENGKLTNGESGSGEKDESPTERNDRSGVPDSLDQPLRALSLSPDTKTTGTRTTAEENNNSSKQPSGENEDTNNTMLKHIRSSSTTSTNNSPKTPSDTQSTPVEPESDSKSTRTSAAPSLRKSTSPLPNNSHEKETTGNVVNGAKSPSPSSNGTDNQVPLPQRFVVKYLGYRETTNLWGIKYTRRPVDEMVTEAKKMLSENTGKTLPLLKMEVTETGIQLDAMPQNNNPEFPSGKFAIEAISYGVQDLVYTRVFAMIVVKSAMTTEGSEQSPHIRLSDFQKQKATSGGIGESSLFRCHAFVCDSRQTARKLTYSLATAFHKFSKSVAAGKVTFQKPKKFAIDLRSPEDIEADLLDSEA